MRWVAAALFVLVGLAPPSPSLATLAGGAGIGTGRASTVSDGPTASGAARAGSSSVPRPAWLPLARPLEQALRGPAEVAGTEGDGLRVRQAADLDAATRAMLPDGARVEVVEGPVQAAGRAWYRVRYGPAGDTGWVAAQYLVAAGAVPGSAGGSLAAAGGATSPTPPGGSAGTAAAPAPSAAGDVTATASSAVGSVSVPAASAIGGGGVTGAAPTGAGGAAGGAGSALAAPEVSALVTGAAAPAGDAGATSAVGTRPASTGFTSPVAAASALGPLPPGGGELYLPSAAAGERVSLGTGGPGALTQGGGPPGAEVVAVTGQSAAVVPLPGPSSAIGPPPGPPSGPPAAVGPPPGPPLGPPLIGALPAPPSGLPSGPPAAVGPPPGPPPGPPLIGALPAPPPGPLGLPLPPALLGVGPAPALVGGPGAPPPGALPLPGVPVPLPAVLPAPVARPPAVPAGTVSVQPLAAPAETDPRFGLVEAFRLDSPNLSRALGARFERVTFWWSGLQDRPNGALNPHYIPLDWLDSERDVGYELVGLLNHTPEWAAASLIDGPRSIPRNLYLPWDHPDNYWGRFTQQVARDYAGRIDDWVIWNEPDIRADDPNAAYFTWAGGVDDYYQLLQVAYRSIKAGNPAARVYLAGLTYWSDRKAGRSQYFERLLDLIAADPSARANGHYFDAATLHLYTDPHGLYHVPRLYRDLMRARGMDKPIWINETNVVPWDDPANRGTGYDQPTDLRCTLADQAAFMLQAFGLGLAGGAERIAVYKGVDSHGAALNAQVDAIERAALTRQDGSLRPAAVAYQTVTRYLAGARAAQYFPGPFAETVVVDRPGNVRVTVVWNAAPRAAVALLPAAGARAELVDAAGRVVPLDAGLPGEYVLALPPATCNTDPDFPSRYVMGGETYLVVEYDVPPDRPARASRAEPL